jgi:long-chain acyl-CoA synthetase
MRQSHTPARYTASGAANATDDLFDNAVRRPEHAAFARKVDNDWRVVTAKQAADEVTALAAGLIADGVEPGDRIALMSGTSYEWMRCDFAIWTAGAVTVPIYETSSPEQVKWILTDSGATAAFVQNSALGAAVADARGSAMRRVWQMTPDGLASLIEAGQRPSADDVERRRRMAGPESLATIVYTSGTTGPPKGCMLTHGNLLAEVRNVVLADGITESVLTKDSSLLLFLPLAHILARVVQLAAVRNGAQLAHTCDLRSLPAELRAFRPTVVLAVPRVFETLHNTAARSAAEARRARLFRAAENTAVVYSQAKDRGGPGPWLRARHRLFDHLVYGKVRAAMGGRVAYAVSGGAPLDAHLGHFLRGAGVTILEGWGLTETTSGATLNLPGAQRIGTVGRPLPGCAVRIADDGEVLVLSDSTFAGYWHNPAATGEAFEAGWLHTGDLGALDDDGYLSITGRKKDIIVTAAGKNIPPAPVEQQLHAHPLVDHCILVGDRRPYVGALITLDPQGFADWKGAHGKPADATVGQLRDDPQLLAALQAPIDRVNAAVSPPEAIRRFRIIPGPFAVGDELTPTQKVRRDYVLSKLADEVDALYAAPRQIASHDR